MYQLFSRWGKSAVTKRRSSPRKSLQNSRVINRIPPSLWRTSNKLSIHWISATRWAWNSWNDASLVSSLGKFFVRSLLLHHSTTKTKRNPFDLWLAAATTNRWRRWWVKERAHRSAIAMQFWTNQWETSWLSVVYDEEDINVVLFTTTMILTSVELYCMSVRCSKDCVLFMSAREVDQRFAWHTRPSMFLLFEE